MLEQLNDCSKEEMKMKKTYRFNIENIDCAACACELQEEIAGLKGVEECHLDFGVVSKLQYICEEKDSDAAEREMRKAVEEDQKNPVITAVQEKGLKEYVYTVRPIDCAACAEKLSAEIAKIDGVESCQADFMHDKMRIVLKAREKDRIEKEIRETVQKDEPEASFSIWKKEEKIEKAENTYAMLYRLIAGSILFALGMLIKGSWSLFLSLAAYAVLGYDVVYAAFRNIGRGQLFDEHFLMTIATFAAMYLNDWKEAAGVMLFYQIGEYLQELAVRRSRRSIGDLMNIRPDSAWVNRDGEYVQVSPEEVRIGEIIRVKPGERVPLDGMVIKGASSLDTASLTGESKPRDVDEGDRVISGAVNQTGVLEIRTEKEYGDSTVARILELVENSDSSKSEPEKFITKFSRYYTPAVVGLAAITAIAVGILTGDFHEGIYRGCTFLVISCPCALVISIPLSFFAGIGGLSSQGILVKGANVIDILASVDQVVLDKTGTLTSGKFGLEDVLHTDNKENTVMIAAYAEHFSNHPIAEGIRQAYGKKIKDDEIESTEEIAGRGILAHVNGKEILAGNYKLMQDKRIACEEEDEAGTLVYTAEDGVYKGCLVLRDQLKEDACEAVKQLHRENKKVMIVSGDNQEITNQIAAKLKVDSALGGCLPEDKVNALREMKKKGEITAFAGDGVNDAPVLANADVSFAMGALGSDAAIEAADVVIMDDKPSKISLAIRSARHILLIANENIYGAISIKVLVLILGALGYASMWMAILADTGVAMICVLNSMRLLHISRKQVLNQ
jgi:Cd2+/Zn2+-exporting ATPase